MISLAHPSLQLFDSYMGFIEEMGKLGETIWEPMTPSPHEGPSTFIDRLLKQQTLPDPPLVAETTYWAVVHQQVVGRISLRHELNESLALFGGHIGYEVRPSWRRRGVAKEMLEKLLLTNKAKEISKLLLTCSPTNIGSVKTIEANGGKLSKTIFLPNINRDTSYYWIDLSKR